MLVRRAVVIPDQHAPIHDRKAVACALKIIEEVKPCTFINLGDVGEFESVSSHKYKRRKQPPLEFILPEVDKDIEGVNKMIDEFDAVLDSVGCKDRFILAGNHDLWAYTGPTHCKKTLESYGCNIIYGHTHDIQRFSMTRMRDGGIGAWSLGCLKNMKAEKNTWLRGRLHNWNHCVGVVDWWKNGNFTVQVIEILNGKAVVNGKELVG